MPNPDETPSSRDEGETEKRTDFPVIKNATWKDEELLRSLAFEFVADEVEERQKLLDGTAGTRVDPEKAAVIVANLDDQLELWADHIRSIIPERLSVSYQVPTPDFALKRLDDGSLVLRVLGSITHFPFGRYVLPFDTADGKGFQELRNPVFMKTDLHFQYGPNRLESLPVEYAVSRAAMEEANINFRRARTRDSYLYWEIVDALGGAALQRTELERDEIRKRLREEEALITPYRSEPAHLVRGGWEADYWEFFVMHPSLGEGRVSLVHEHESLCIFPRVEEFKAA